ncbi:MAG: hypothetical protein N3F05_00670 [Candidatus Diapherotrites archaeon]|nr:hypothetical protein [Candidatus Diapherotrites archaeon]
MLDHTILSKDNLNQCGKKAQAYLLVTFILAAFVLAAIVSIRTASTFKTTGAFEIENIKKELAIARASGIYLNDLNSVMSQTALRFKNYLATKGLTMKLAFVAYDDNRQYVFGNYTGEDCNYYSSVVSGTVPDGTTVIISKETLLNDYLFNFCDASFNLKNKFKYRLELLRNAEVIAK